MDDSSDSPNHTIEEAPKMNNSESINGLIKTPSTAPRFQVAPVSASEFLVLLAWLVTILKSLHNYFDVICLFNNY